MDCIVVERQEDVMEVPEIDGDVLVELLDASLAAEEEAGPWRHGGRHQLGFTADVGDGWVDEDSSLQELDAIHPRQEEGCEDCGLDDILSDFDGCGCSAAAAPYDAVDDGDPVGYWSTEEMEAAATTVGAPFAGGCVGEWYMDGMAMELDDGRSYYSFYPAYGGEACTEQLCSSPLWE